MPHVAVRFSQLLALLCFLVAGVATTRHFWVHTDALSGEELKLVGGFIAAGICLSYPKLFFGWATAVAQRWPFKTPPAPLLLFALLSSVLTSQAVAQSPLRVDPIEQRSTDRQHFQGHARCGFDHPYPEQLRALTAEEAAENSVHEAVHLRQLGGNCDSVMAVWDTNFVARIEAEAEATCEGWRAGNVSPALWHSRAVRAAAWWARFTTVGYEQAIAAFDRKCQLESHYK